MRQTEIIRGVSKAFAFALVCAALTASATAAEPVLRVGPHDRLPADLQARVIRTLADDRALSLATQKDPIVRTLEAAGASPLGVPDWVSQEVSADDGATSDQFGWAVVLQGDTALIGAPNALNAGTNLYGAVYVFTRTDGVWTQGQKFAANGGSFGGSIGLSGTTALVSANSEDNFRGAVYVFTQSGGVWTQTQKLLPDNSTEHDQFGWSLALQGDTAMISSYTPTNDDEGNINQGAVYVFTADAGGTWTQTQKLVADDGQSYDLFGSPVYFDGDTAVIGSGYVPINGDSTRGSAYVFNRVGGVWSQTQKLLPSDGDPYDAFGGTVFFAGDQVYVGAVGALGAGTPPSAAGAVYVYTLSGGTWSQTQKVTPSDAPATGSFGQAIAVQGNTMLVGAVGAVGGNDGQGAIYRFQGNDGTWTQAAKWIAADGGSPDNLGWSIALNNGTAVSGAYNHSGPALFSGAAYFYTAPANPPVAQVSTTPLEFATTAGASASSTLTIANVGGDSLDWAIADTASKAKVKVNLHPNDGVAPAHLGAVGGRRMPGSRQPAPWTPRDADGEVSYVLDDGTYEDAVSLNNQTIEAAAVWLNRFTPAAGTGPFTIDSISIEWPQNNGTTLVGNQVDLVAYYDADGDGDPSNAVRLGSDQLVTIDSLDSFIDYTVNFAVPGAGDIYVGFVNVYALGGTTPIRAPAAIDEDSSQGRSWLAAMSQGDPDVDNLGNNDLFGTADDLGIPGNWLIRATGLAGGAGGGCSNPADVPWLSETPANGSIGGGSSQDVTITADAAALAPGQYSAVLCVTTNDPANAMIQVPVSLTVSQGDVIFADGFDGGN